MENTTVSLNRELDRLRNELQHENQKKNEYFLLMVEQGKVIDAKDEEIKQLAAMISKLNSWLVNALSDLNCCDDQDWQECADHIKALIERHAPTLKVNFIFRSDFDKKRIELENIDRQQTRCEEEYKDRPELLKDVLNLLDETKNRILHKS